jgi:tetratricopeptide (TPR) repeat protein
MLVGWTLAAAPALASDVEAAIADAIAAAREGHCADAYERLAGIAELESRARLLAGQCRVRAGLYPEALADLDRIRAAPDLDATQRGNVELARAIALYRLERIPEADAALRAARGRTSEEAQYELYRGLVDLQQGEPERAAEALETAARLDPDQTEPVASFYAGMAWREASERGKARLALERVVARDGDGVWGKQAQAMLESIELFPSYVRVSGGIEYDDNVILRGGQTVQPGAGFVIRQDGEADWRGVWLLDAGVQLFNQDDWSAGVTGRYYGSAQFDLTEFDTQYPRIGAYVAHRLEPNTTVQARYEFGHAWLDEDSFLRTQLGELGLAHTWDRAGRTLVVADVIANDLRFTPDEIPDVNPTPPPLCTATTSGCSPLGVDESEERNQDGVGYGIALIHRFPLPIPDALDDVIEVAQIEGSYRFGYYDAEGDEWEHFSHYLTAGLRIELPLDFRVGCLASYEFRDFANPSTFPDNEVIGQPYTLASQDREEHEWNFTAEVEKDLTEWLSLSARYSYRDSESNRRVYDYTRNVVGAYVNLHWD